MRIKCRKCGLTAYVHESKEMLQDMLNGWRKLGYKFKGLPCRTCGNSNDMEITD